MYMRGLPFKKEARIRLPANPYPLFRSKHSLRHSPPCLYFIILWPYYKSYFPFGRENAFWNEPAWKAPILSLLSKHMNRHTWLPYHPSPKMCVTAVPISSSWPLITERSAASMLNPISKEVGTETWRIRGTSAQYLSTAIPWSGRKDRICARMSFTTTVQLAWIEKESGRM